MVAERRVQRRMQAARERIVRSARALFAKNGIYQTTVEDITEAADVGKGTFYEHFPSKTAIIQHLLHEGFEALLRQCRSEVGSGRTTRDRVKRLLRAQLHFFDERGDLLSLFHQVRGLLKLRPGEANILQKEYKRYLRFLAEELGALLEGKKYSEADLTQVACAMAGYVTGYLSYRVITGVNENTTRDLRVASRIFLEGIERNGWHE
jgi:AcrR family transcriptional regulator